MIRRRWLFLFQIHRYFSSQGPEIPFVWVYTTVGRDMSRGSPCSIAFYIRVHSSLTIVQPNVTEARSEVPEELEDDFTEQRC